MDGILFFQHCFHGSLASWWLADGVCSKLSASCFNTCLAIPLYSRDPTTGFVLYIPLPVDSDK